MPATPEQIDLAKKFEPVLLFHPDERYQPLDPKRWFESSALWPVQAPRDDKSKWGFAPPPPPPGTTPPTFPRHPLLVAGQISLVPGETQAGQTYVVTEDGQYLLTRGGERELFLEFSGWSDTPDVTEASQNTSANLKAIQDRTNGDEFAAFRQRYAVEIVETDAIERLVEGFRRDLDMIGLLKSLFKAPRLLLYHFLYPGHEEELLGCELVGATVRDGNFSGDWGCVAVFFDGDAPIWVGTSTHNAGLLESVTAPLRVGMVVSPWRDARKDGQHPFVFVARGTHGNYLTPGDKERPSFTPAGVDISKSSCGAVEDAYKAAREAAELANDLAGTAETVKDWVVILAKVVVGGVLGGIFGAVIGLIAGIIEAVVTEASSVDVPPPLPENKPVDQPPPVVDETAVQVGLAILPQGLALPPDIRVTSTQAWDSTEKTLDGRSYPFVVLRGEQPWWPPAGSNSPPAYEGRWGVRVQQDPQSRRCGMEFPDFRSIFFRELLLKLTSS